MKLVLMPRVRSVHILQRLYRRQYHALHTYTVAATAALIPEVGGIKLHVAIVFPNTRHKRTMVRQKVLSGLTICPSGIDDANTLSTLSTEAARLGATFSNDLTRSVTHLICTKAGSLKHREVCQWNLQSPACPVHIVRPSWLAACSSAMAHVSTASHTLPPLGGLKVCCSGIGLNVKEKVARICVDLGAVYSKSLGPGCTHLLCEEPAGKKYEFAVENKEIFIVRPTWIVACERLKVLVDESLYLLGKDAVTSMECGSLERPSLQLHDRNYGKRNDVERKASQSAEETVSKSAREENRSLSLTENVSKLIMENGQSQSVAGTLSKSNTNVNLEVQQLPSSSWLNMSPGLFLDAFTFYLTPSAPSDKSLNAPLRAKALKLLAYGGGSLSDELTPLVNYVVVIRLPVLPSKIEEIEHAQKMGAILVTLDWLERCVVEQRVIEHDNPSFDCLTKDNGGNVDESSQAQHHADFKSSLFQGMRCALGPLALYDSGAVATVRQKLQRGRGKVLAHDSRGVVSSGVATHVVCGESLAAGARRLVDAARANNSHVVVVTVEWIDACLQAGKLMRVEDCVLYAPVPHETPLRDMLRSKVSVTITGHQSQSGVLNARRDILSRLARLLGAGYSERMTKGKTTHLIADGQSGNRSKKVGMAKLWGIFIVNYKWLIECANTGVVVDASDFPVDEGQETPGRNESGINADENDNGEDNFPGSARAENATSKPARSSLDSTRKILFTSPSKARRSPRFQQKTELATESATEAGDKLFERFTAGLLKSSVGINTAEREVHSPPLTRRRSTRSPSVSLDVPEDEQKQWSLDASQSQMIVHRDLTPPPTPGRGLRSMPARAAKRRRGE